MTERAGYSYQGQELDVFAAAIGWKSYWASRIRRWVSGNVLEVGAGLGSNTALLQSEQVASWTCLEPDPKLAAVLQASVQNLPRVQARCGTINDLGAARFDTILYIDVLEHIEHDAGELAKASGLLENKGHIIVVAPAHAFLFSEFDASIGHHRRYNKKSLRACAPPGCVLETMFYLDSVGLFASLANRAMLRQSYPTLAQIHLWDRYMVPVSKVLDPLLGHQFGKTICCVWTRSA